MSICANLAAKEDLIVLLYLHDIYNIDRISVYVIKSSSQTSSPLFVETQKGCVPNMNKSILTMKAMIRI